MTESKTLEYDSMAKAEKARDKRILDELARLGGKATTDEDIVFEGSKLVLPKTMTPRGAIKFLTKHIEQEEEVTSFSKTFKYRPWDGANAMFLALKEVFGTTGIAKATYSFFGKNPPKLITIETGINSTTQVPWGKIDFPPLEAEIFCGGIKDNELGVVFTMTVNAPRKYRAHVEGLFRAVKHQLEVSSIYRGNAINGAEQPGFIDPFSVDRNKVVYTDTVKRQLEANIWSLLEHTTTHQAAGLPLKRAVLLAGPYGCGKSLAAMLTAQTAVNNGWTFVQCRPGKDDLDTVMQTAMLYPPAVVFYEDVDTIAQGGDPTKIAQLLDMFDGIAVKGTQLVMVLTTNHPELIHKGMVRPGRLDAVVKIDALDERGVEELIKATVAPVMLSDDLDYDRIGKAMDGFLPAFIKEAIDRAQRYAIARTNGSPEKLSTDDFVDAAEGLRPQLELMNEASEGQERPEIEQAMRGLVQQTMGEMVVHVREDDEPWAVLRSKDTYAAGTFRE